MASITSGTVIESPLRVYGSGGRVIVASAIRAFRLTSFSRPTGPLRSGARHAAGGEPSAVLGEPDAVTGSGPLSADFCRSPIHPTVPTTPPPTSSAMPSINAAIRVG